MIEWDGLILTIPLSLPEIIASVAAIVFLIRHRPSLDGEVRLWLLVPCAVLAFSTVTRFLPLWLEPVREAIGAVDDDLAVVWYGDLLFRTPAWAALLYGLFWKLPQREPTPPLDQRATQAAITAALLASLLTTDRPQNSGRTVNATELPSHY